MEELMFICGIMCNGDVKHFHALANNSFRLSVEYFHKGSAKCNELDCVDAVMSLCNCIYSMSWRRSAVPLSHDRSVCTNIRSL